MGSAQVRAVAQPHSADPGVLSRQREIYRREQTPIREGNGPLTALDVRPARPQVAGRHLNEISSGWGDRGVAQSIRGLGVTRGWSFAELAVQQASPHVQRQAARMASLGAANLGDTPVFTAAAAMRASHGGVAVPASVTSRLPAEVASGLDGVRIHDDPGSHTAARTLGARAVTVGRSIYMGAGEYQPSTDEGQRLLAHEIAHTIQQHGVTGCSGGDLPVSDPGSAAEVEAGQFADAVSAGRSDGQVEVTVPRRGSAGTASLMRVISFTRANDAVATLDPGVQENALAGTFQIANGVPAAPHFNWTTDITIHGDAGDPFADFQVGPLQVLKNWWFNVWWGTGANRTHRSGTVATPIRDALTAGDTWYADVLASANFAAAGDVRATGLNDSPGIPNTPFANPVAGRASTRGWFNYGLSFVSYISARDTNAGTFRHLAHVYWNMSINGNFDTARAAGAQVQVQTGATNASRVFSGASADVPPILGGAVPNAAAVITTT